MMESNEVWERIGVGVTRFANDESYKCWQDPVERVKREWRWDAAGALEVCCLNGAEEALAEAQARRASASRMRRRDMDRELGELT